MNNNDIKDYINRDELSFDYTKLESVFKNKTILVTGAGGSIGSEIVSKLLKFDYKKLVLLDRSEVNIYKNFKLLEQAGDKVALELCDVTRFARIEQIFRKYKPDFVFHTAAYKHVPVLEKFPIEAIHNNVLATKYIADLSNDYGVTASVFISTDKAVYPTTILGLSKRLGEMYYNSFDCASTNNGCHMIAVRFGNVIASSGSVFKIFEDQISKGGPVTVTDPETDRFFMTAHEAASLVLFSVLERLTNNKRGSIYVLDMGKAIKISDIAKKMIAKLSGFDKKVEIKYVGLRAGDKLNEKLYEENEKIGKTFVSEIMSVNSYMYEFDEINKIIANLEDMARVCDVEKSAEYMRDVVINKI